MQEQLYDMLMKQDEITWQTIIYELIKSEQMDPWDIDISILSQRYMAAVKKLQEMNFFISGKVILACALLLKIKSDKLVAEEIAGFDSYLFNKQEIEELEEFIQENTRYKDVDIPKLAIKTPQARKRKVSVNDLINALQKALDVSNRKILRKIHEESFKGPPIPEKRYDITEMIQKMFEKINLKLLFTNPVTFSHLLESDKREDKIMTFIPLLHLDFQNKIVLEQKEHFGDIEVHIKTD
ncbi:segregation/condensation protein A [Candidatus Woesearchaeota archaeon]|nr:segregation/condensation protein A [Candidatus Woesearchaeota archaeon]